MADNKGRPIYQMRDKRTGRWRCWEDRGAMGDRPPQYIPMEFTAAEVQAEYPHGVPDDVEVVQVSTY